MKHPVPRHNREPQEALAESVPTWHRASKVQELLECCVLSCELSAAGVVAIFDGGVRLLQSFGDEACCVALERATDHPIFDVGRFGRDCQEIALGDDASNTSWFAAAFGEEPSRFVLVAVAEGDRELDPRQTRQLELFAGQLDALTSHQPRTPSAAYHGKLGASEKVEIAPDPMQWRAVELITEAVVALDRDLRFRYLNVAAEALFAHPRDELIGLKADRVFPPSPETRQAFDRALAQQESTVLSDYSLSIGAWLETRVFPSPDGIMVYIRDVTERERQREELRKSEERFRALSAATNDAIWEWDIAQNRLLLDDSIEGITGYAAEELSDPADWMSHVHPDDIGHLLESLAGARDVGPLTSAIEYRFRHADGEYIHLCARGEMRCDEDGEPVRLLGGVSDVTERHQLTEQLMRAERLETLGRMSSSIAHDLNNLLTPIKLSLSVARSCEVPPEVSEELDLIQDCVGRGADLTQRLLSFARGDEGDRIEADLSEIAREVHRILRGSMPPSVTFSLRLPPRLPKVKCDPSQMHQVMVNLCVNARDAVAEEGTITMSVESTEASKPGFDGRMPPGHYVRLSVTDDGAGIPANRLESIFEPFFTTKAKTEGTGLGLATVRSIVESHRGFIEVASDGETTFTVWLPSGARVANERS